MEPRVNLILKVCGHHIWAYLSHRRLGVVSPIQYIKDQEVKAGLDSRPTGGSERE